MFRKLAAAAALMLIAGCGTSRTSSSPVLTIDGHPCSYSDTAMQCVLAPPPNGLALQRAGSYGVDFAWSCPSPAGRGFGASYLSPDTSKNWTRACVDAYHAHHAATVAVWEAGAFDAEGSFNSGFTAAYRARHQARNLGEPDNRPVDFAIDCDCTGPAVATYFSGANAGDQAVTHLRGNVDAYGGYRPLAYLCARHLVGHQNWQTYAWSGGLWLPASCAPLEQYLNDSSVDYDRATATDYGQWPAPAPACDRACQARARHARLARDVAYRTRLRQLLVNRGCRSVARRQAIRHHNCRVWFAEGDRVNRDIRRLGGH